MRIIDSHAARWQLQRSCQGVQLPHSWLVPCDTCVNNWLLKRHRTVLSRHESTTTSYNSLVYGASVAVVEKLQRAKITGHLSAAQMCQRQTAACPTAHPVQNSGHNYQGSVDFRSSVHRRNAPSDDAVSAVHRCSASLCAVDTHWDSQASVLRGGSERLELTTEWNSQRQFAVNVLCQTENTLLTVALHILVMTYPPTSTPLY